MIDDKKIEEEATNYAQDGYNNYDDNIQRYYDWDTRSLEDVCQMCHKVYDLAYMLNIKK